MNGKSKAVSPSDSRKIWHQVYAGICRIPAAWLLVLPLLLLIPTILDFPYPALDSAYSDITISHYPNAIYLRGAISEFRGIPFWSSTIMSGYPFAANPLSGLWYPPGWLALILPLPLGFNLVIGLHLVWGGLGLYSLLRAEGLGNAAALLGGLAFSLLPKLFAHYGAGHLTLLYAVTWTPWLLLSQRTYLTKSGWFKVPPGLVLALIFLADVRWGAFATITWWAYSAVFSHRTWWGVLKNVFLQTGLGLLLAAPQLLPLIEFSSLSTRAELGAGDVLTHSLPALNLLGLLFPNRGTNHEWVLYVGGIVSLLALGGLMMSSARRNKYFWGILCLATILVALGSQIPGSELIARLPLISWLRVPSRALFLTGLGFASLAGYGLDAILHNPPQRQVQVFLLTLFGLSLFSILLLLGFGFITGEFASGMLWGTLGLITSAAWIVIGLKSKLPITIWIGGVILIAVMDLIIFDLNSFAGREAEQVLAEGAPAAQYIADQGGDSRTYSPSYSIPQQTAIQYGIRMTDGVDPLQIASYANFMEQASGVARDGYSVTIPPFASGEPGTDNAGYSPDAEKLGLLNVGYVVSGFELHSDGLEFERKIDEAFIYRNESQRPPAWIQPADRTAKNDIKPAHILHRSPNRLEISATGPGTLVVSEIYYPGWSVRVDGVDEELQIQDETLMGIDLEPGVHSVELEFRPRSVYSGVALFIAGMALLVWNIKNNAQQVSRG